MSGARPLLEADFPGYAAAVAHENLVRGAACLGISSEICGLTIKPLTAFHVRQLGFARSPFLISDITLDALLAKQDILDDIMRFLWIVSPMWKQGALTRKHFWQRRSARDHFNKMFAPILKQPADKVCREILEFIEEAYLDAGEASGTDKTFFAFEIGIAIELREFGFRADFWNSMPPEKNPVHVPLKIVFQLRKHRHYSKGALVSNKSERLISDGLAKMNSHSKPRNN